VLFAIHARTGDAVALQAAVEAYRAARAEYARVAEITTGVYVPDLTYGPEWYQRGHWKDRLPAIDKDIAAVAQGSQGQADVALPPARVAALVSQVLGRPHRASPAARHTPARTFTPGRALEVALEVTVPAGGAVTLHYRHVDQAEAWQSVAMHADGDAVRGVIPADFTGSPFPLQYYFEGSGPDGAWLYPGLGTELTEQPYYAIRSA